MTEIHISRLNDAIVVLRHVETASELRRGVLVLRMRGSDHEHQIRELVVGPAGVTVGEPFLGLGGVLSGQPIPGPRPTPPG